LPDGIFPYQKSQFGEILVGLGMEDVGHVVLFMAVWYTLWSFGIFFPFWYVWSKTNLATLS
jgi:hypothetical protein